LGHLGWWIGSFFNFPGTLGVQGSPQGTPTFGAPQDFLGSHFFFSTFWFTCEVSQRKGSGPHIFGLEWGAFGEPSHPFFPQGFGTLWPLSKPFLVVIPLGCYPSQYTPLFWGDSTSRGVLVFSRQIYRAIFPPLGGESPP